MAVPWGKGWDKCCWFRSLIEVGKKLHLSLDFQSFKLLYLLGRRKKKEWPEFWAFLMILSAFPMQHTVKIALNEGNWMLPDQLSIDIVFWFYFYSSL